MVIRTDSGEHVIAWSVPHSSNHASMVSFLNGFRSDAAAMAALRRVASSGGTLSYVDDDAVIRQVAAMISSGKLVIARDVVVTGISLPAETPAPVERPAAAPPKKETSREAADDGPTFRSGHDGASQAASLRAASESGVPFCEECERARREREAA